MRTKYSFFALLVVCALALTGCGGGTGSTTSFAVRPSAVSAQATLQSVAAEKHLAYGISVESMKLATDSSFASAVASNVGLVVPENELKWDTTEGQPGVFDFSGADAILAFAQQHNLVFRGHTLIWHGQSPAWAGADPNTAQQQMVNHITTEVSHFAGKVQSWDVVNEPLDVANGRADGLRNNNWLQSLGPGYIDLAFRTAHAADPKALLVINDYGMEYSDAEGEKRRTAMLALLTHLKQTGVPIDALGLQSHLDPARNGDFSASKLAAFLQQVASMGLKIYVTELDVTDTSLPADIATRDTRIAQTYSDYLSAVLSQPAVSIVVTWGLSDRYTWLTTQSPRKDGLPVRPLPMDSNLQSKQAYNAMLGAFANAASR